MDEMRGRRRGCWDSSSAGGCDVLGEVRTRSETGRLLVGMVAISLAMLAMPAALLADHDRYDASCACPPAGCSVVR